MTFLAFPLHYLRTKLIVHAQVAQFWAPQRHFKFLHYNRTLPKLITCEILTPNTTEQHEQRGAEFVLPGNGRGRRWTQIYFRRGVPTREKTFEVNIRTLLHVIKYWVTSLTNWRFINHRRKTLGRVGDCLKTFEIYRRRREEIPTSFLFPNTAGEVIFIAAALYFCSTGEFAQNKWNLTSISIAETLKITTDTSEAPKILRQKSNWSTSFIIYEPRFTVETIKYKMEPTFWNITFKRHRNEFTIEIFQF